MEVKPAKKLGRGGGGGGAGVNFGPNELKLAAKLVFFLVIFKVGSLVFLEIT